MKKVLGALIRRIVFVWKGFLEGMMFRLSYFLKE